MYNILLQHHEVTKMITHVSTDCNSLPLYTHEDLDDALLRISDPVARDAVYAIWHTGLRLSEYIDLTTDMISDTTPTITIPGIYHRTATHDIHIDHHVWMWFRARAESAGRRHGDRQTPCHIFRAGLVDCHNRASMMAHITQAITRAIIRDELPPGTSCTLLRYRYTRRLYDMTGGNLDAVQRQTGYINRRSLVYFLRAGIEAGDC